MFTLGFCGRHSTVLAGCSWLFRWEERDELSFFASSTNCVGQEAISILNFWTWYNYPQHSSGLIDLLNRPYLKGGSSFGKVFQRNDPYTFEHSWHSRKVKILRYIFAGCRKYYPTPFEGI